VNIILIPPTAIFDLYPLLAEYFDKFADRATDGTTAHGLALDVANTVQQCWVVREEKILAVALTKLERGSILTAVLTHCTGTEREKWQDLLGDELEAWAGAVGAARFKAICRGGWSPFLKSRGMRETHRILEKNIG
jgi:hypothetical protein